MKAKATSGLLFCICIFVSLMLNSHKVNGQLTPTDVVKAMSRGINMGNTLEPPNGEGDWGNPAVVESNFDDYKNAGFTCVRLPITWDKHSDTTSPFAINPTWLNRIEQIVDWGLKRKLIIIINAHHDGWIKDSYTATHVARFDSIWSQIATRFKNKSDSLLFEVINEPNPMTLQHINELNARTIKTIRKTNPTRIVLFSGNSYSNSQELVQAAVPSDNYIMGYYHSYDPYPFGLVGTGTYGSDADIAATVAKFNQVATWRSQNNVQVVLGEFGFTYLCEYNSRMCAYATVTEKALLYNVPFMAWEDGGDFKFYYRPERKWSEIKDILIHTYKESPNKMKISLYKDTSLQIHWNNRTTAIDSIIVERRINNGNFTYLAKLDPTVSQFIDSTTTPGKAYYYRLRANLKDSIEIQSYPIMMRVLPTHRAPYTGQAIPIPGIVEAENYDIGGEGLTYHDVDDTNNGGAYRLNDGVDIGQQATGKYHVGYVAAGEWLEYTINVQQAGTYNISAYLAASAAGGQLTLQFKNGTTTAFTATATSSWSTYNKISNTFNLLAGEQIMRLNIAKTPAFDIDYLNFILLSLDVSSAALSIEPFAGSTSVFDITSNTGWSVASNQTWLSVNTVSGSNNGTITLTAKANTIISRTAIITVKGTGGLTKSIIVTQAPLASLNISSTALSIAAMDGSTSIFDVASNTSWNIASDQTWLSINTTSGSSNASITLTATANQTTSTRTATITVTGIGAITKTITVTQAASSTAITDEIAQAIEIYPNPSSGIITFKFGKTYNQPVYLEIFSIDGKQICQRTIQTGESTTIDLTGYHGIFLIKLIVGGQIVNRKICIQ